MPKLPTREEMQNRESLTDRLRARFGSPPPAARVFAETVLGDRSKITEDAFTQDELEILRETAEKRITQGKKTIGYGDYGHGDDPEKSFATRRPRTPDNPHGQSYYPSGTESFVHALTDPRSSLSYTLGMANARKEKDGTIVVNDKYDFAASRKQVRDLKNKGLLSILGQVAEGFRANGLLGIGNVIGNLATPNDDGREVEIRIPPRRKMLVESE